MIDGETGAQMLLAEMGDLAPEIACENVAELCKTGAHVIVFGQDPSIHTYRALLRAGALEYFPMPVSAQDILSFEPTTQIPANLPRAVALQSFAIGVIGTNGGVGASSLAASLGYLSSAKAGGQKKTALVDADLAFGSLALDLDRDGTPGLRDALNAPARIDDTFLEATMDQISETLSIYSYACELQADATGNMTRWSDMLERLSSKFATTICDLPRDLILHETSVLRGFDAAVLVVPAGYAGVSAAMRLCTFLRQHAPDLRLDLVLSEVRKDAQLSPKDIATALELEMVAVLPRCDAQLVRAQRKGRTVAELFPRSDYAKACHAVLTSLRQEAAPKYAKRGLLEGLFK